MLSCAKTEMFEELPKRTKTERRESLEKLDSNDRLGAEEPLTMQEKALLDARLAAYAKDPTPVAPGKKLRTESEFASVDARMNRRLIVRAEAETDITDAADWYGAQEPASDGA